MKVFERTTSMGNAVLSYVGETFEFFAGVESQGACIVGAIKNLDLSKYKQLNIYTYCANNNEGLNNYFVGLTEEENLTNLNGSWNDDQLHLISSGKCFENRAKSIYLDLTKLDRNKLKNICLYIRANSGFSGGGIWVYPILIEAFKRRL